MIEFLARWVLVGVVTAGMLLLSGSEAVSVSGCWLAGVWIGFLNAFVRPLVLRVSADRVLWLLGVILSLLNAGMFLTLRAWVPGVALGEGDGMGHALLVGGVVTVVAWTLSSFFYAHDGHWHWITYHGRIVPKTNPDSPP
jgi:uncharacterized membrane protein YvlD (DUF360 family)